MEYKEGRGMKRTAASRSAGSFAHCVYPIVLSKPLMLTRNNPRDIYPRRQHCVPKNWLARPFQRRKEGRKEYKGRSPEARSEKGDAHESLTLIGTPCNGPFKRPLLENSESSLRASSLASPNSTMVFVAKVSAIVGTATAN
jgi:hypothetical protein